MCEDLTNIIIPNSAEIIGDEAFSYCYKITNVTIPDSVTTIGYNAFNNCPALNEIVVSENNQNYSSDSFGVLYNKDKTKLIQYPIGNERTEFVIPDSVTTVGDSAFEYCVELTSVTIHNSVKAIEDSAFRACDKLTTVTIGDGVTTIEDTAFLYCDSLTDVYYKGSEAQWQQISIGSSNDYLTNATIHYNS